MEITSRIAEVTVYENQALVTRTARVTLEPGSHQLRLVGLPAGLLQETLRVRGEGAATLHGFDTRVIYTGTLNSERAEAIEAALRRLDEEQAQHQAEHALQQQQFELLARTAQRLADSFAHQVSEGRTRVADWEDTLGFIEAGQRKAHAAMAAIAREQESLDERREALEAERTQLWSFQSKQAIELLVTVEAPTAGPLTLMIEYVMPGAGWTPVYEARLSAAGDRLDWRYGAMVSQRTGEHWEDIKLRLSTAQPATGSRPPEVPEWFIEAYKPIPVAKEMARKRAAAPGFGGGGDDEALYEAAAELDAPPPPMMAAPAPEPKAAMASQGTSVTLEVPRPLTIPSAGEPHHAPVGEAQFPPSLRYRVVPKVVAQAFLEVESTHAGPWPILPGPCKCFVGADYVGTVRLDEDVLPGQRFTLPMGTDRAIQVKRTRLVRKAGENGLLQKQRVHEYQFEVLVASYKDAPQAVTVVEPIPRSGREELKVKLADANKAPRQDEPGQLSWELTLKPGEQQKLTWGYRVEYPSAMSVVGLE